MLVQFSIRNYRTFKDKATLTLVASNYDKGVREEENIIKEDKFNLRILKSAVIYGANASGKSKFIEALMFMRHFVISSSKESQKGDKIDVEPFKLSIETEYAPTEFEVIFIYKGTLYRYGFEADNTEVVSEWLYHKNKTKEVELFYREGQNFDVHTRSFSKGHTIVKEGLIRNNALLISVAAQFNDAISENVIEWFKKLGALSGLREEGYQGYTVGKTSEVEYKTKILKLLQAADLGIQDIFIEMLDTEKLPKTMPKDIKEFILKKSKEENAQFLSEIYTIHKKYDKNKKFVGSVNFSLDDDESFGTQKFYYLTGPILDTLENGYTLIVDELDSKLHPNLVCKLVSLFNSKVLNPKNAQLIFNTHDTNLLNSGLFRRDQVWFTEKDKFGEARLYSLSDFKSDEVRKTEAFEDNYIRGKYGAIPFLGLFDNLIYDKLMVRNENEE
ncbi:ATP-binding protein [Cytophagaceae bacterium ABcell3]|nr:ATP-binding protein [Cytophagaceae bacterium ABcell3]